jgi:D-beta-D-heptose 7-phosphate kinase/D-beta-D-heptose 1-phosphate adenosyltransferase
VLKNLQINNKGKMIIVIGDFIVDEFHYGQATRISPEAPNLILDLDEIKIIKGGAYNVVEHLRNLDNKVHFVSLIGRKNINQIEVDNFFCEDDELLYDDNRLRTLKTRMVAKYRHTTLLRVDQEDRFDISPKQEEKIIDIIKKLINFNECNGICIVDYCKGFVTNGLAREIINLSAEKKIKTYVDSKSRDVAKFTGAYLLKPNKNEFLLMKSLYGFAEFSDELFVGHLYKNFKIENILRTLGEDGVELYIEGKKAIDIQGHICEIKELSGAGDSLLAGTVHLHSEGTNIINAVDKANRAASIFISNGVDYRLQKSDLN